MGQQCVVHLIQSFRLEFRDRFFSGCLQMKLERYRFVWFSICGLIFEVYIFPPPHILYPHRPPTLIKFTPTALCVRFRSPYLRLCFFIRHTRSEGAEHSQLFFVPRILHTSPKSHKYFFILDCDRVAPPPPTHRSPLNPPLRAVCPPPVARRGPPLWSDPFGHPLPHS